MFTIKIAGVCVGIDNRHDYVHTLCRDYIVDEPPDFTVSVSDEQLERERSCAAVGDSLGEHYYESVCLYRSICEQMIDYNCFLFHSSVIEMNGKAYAFAAKSGVGKSTHTALWRRRFGDSITVINGDKPLLRVDGRQIIAYGTPWSGKENINTNTCAPLAAVCFLSRAEQNSIYKMKSVETIQQLFHQLIVPTDKTRVERLFTMLDVLVQSVPFYSLSCNISDEAVALAYSTMIEGSLS